MLTPEERRGALLILGLVLLGGVWDASRAWWKETPPPAEPPPAAAAARAVAAPDARWGIAPIAAEASTAGGPADTARVPSSIDVNRAGPSELDALPGIGPVLARRIVEHRSRNGGFRSLEELRAVRGIGPSLIARLRGRVRFGS